MDAKNFSNQSADRRDLDRLVVDSEQPEPREAHVPATKPVALPPIHELDKLELLSASSERSDSLMVCGLCPERVYVQLKIPSEFASLETITIEVTSNDQGFADEKNTPSFSDFDVNIIDPDGHERRRWRAFVNRVADLEPFTQTRTWPSNDAQVTDLLQLSKQVVQSFRPHDTIQLLPLARFGGWRNCTHSAKISITGRRASAQTSHIMPRANTLPHVSDITSLARLRRTSTQPSGHKLYCPIRQDHREIRLLQILPGEPGSDVECILQHTSLTRPNSMQYEALSYCWGDARDIRRVVISGEQLPVVANLYDALQRLRRLDEVRTMWIDAICINQGDTTERAWQVQEMRNIYSCASRVIVWLGEQEKNLWPSKQADIRSIFEQHKHVAEAHLPPATLDASLVTEQELQDNLPALDLAHTLLENPWFSRVWVLQEVFHARSIHVLCGDQTCSWPLIMQINTHSQRHRFRLRDYQKAMPALFADLFPLTRADRDAPGYFNYSPRRPQADILDIVVAGLDLDASDPRDKLFALLPFTEEFREPALQPDYDQEPALVFRHLTRWWIRSRQSLRILSAVHCSVGRTWQAWNPGLERSSNPLRPSWSLWYDGKSAFGLATLGLSINCSYSASGSTGVDVKLLDETKDQSILALRGIVLDEIASIGKYPYFAVTLGSAPGLEQFQQVYETLFDVNNDATIYSAGSQARSYGFYSKEEQHKRLNKTYDHFFAHEEHSRAKGTIECHSDSFFESSKGLLGLCPQQARPGDVVVVLHGGNVPLLLRRRGDTVLPDHYTLVGECYLPEYMNGEAIDAADLDTRVFNLS